MSPKDSPDPQPWVIKKSHYLYKGPWLTVRQDHVLLANGAEMPDYYVLEYTDWVNAVLVTPDQQVVLIRIYRHGLGEVHYELPGGCVDEGETHEQAARRESLEETGFEASQWKSLGICCANPATHNNRTHLFLATEARKVSEPKQEDTEEIVTVLVSRRELADILESGAVISASHALALTRYLYSSQS